MGSNIDNAIRIELFSDHALKGKFAKYKKHEWSHHLIVSFTEFTGKVAVCAFTFSNKVDAETAMDLIQQVKDYLNLCIKNIEETPVKKARRKKNLDDMEEMWRRYNAGPRAESFDDYLKWQEEFLSEP